MVDGIRGLQYKEHDNGQPDQMMRHNLVLAGRDPVATDALVAQLMGFNPWDIEFLHMAQQRGMGNMDLERADIIGDDPARFQSRWGKPKGWYGRGNRHWWVTVDPQSPIASWSRYTAPTDSLHFDRVPGMSAVPGSSYAAVAQVLAEGRRKAYLWVGARGHATVELNGETVMAEENLTRFRIGQFQKPVELRSGENLLVFRVQSDRVPAQLSVLLAGPRNDGDTVDGIRWTA